MYHTTNASLDGTTSASVPNTKTIGAAGVAAITAGGALLSQGANAYSVGRMNRKNRKFAEHMYEKQRTDALADWENMNQYNSPVEQMKRLKAAGLNPNLVYGDGANSPSATIRSSDFSQPQTEAPQFSNPVPAVLDSYFNTSIQEQQLRNMRKTEELIEAQRRATLANAGLKEIDLKTQTELQQMGIQTSKGLSDYQRSSADAESARTKADMLLLDKEIKEATKSDTVTFAAEKIIQMRINNAKTKAEKDVLVQKLDLLKKEGVLKQLDVEFAQNLNKRWDGYLLKILGLILGNARK